MGNRPQSTLLKTVLINTLMVVVGVILLAITVKGIVYQKQSYGRNVTLEKPSEGSRSSKGYSNSEYDNSKSSLNSFSNATSVPVLRRGTLDQSLDVEEKWSPAPNGDRSGLELKF